MEHTVTLCAITQEFSGRRVLDGLDLSVQRGEIFGLLGPSGAGKTTLVKILTGQLCQTGGTATLLGADTRRLDAATRRKLGVMLDSCGLYERFTVLENLNFYAELCRVPRSRIEAVLQATGLYEARKTPAGRLSKGMRSRLALARAVLNEPELLFLDEPTSGLDPATAQVIHRLLLEQKRRGATIFLTTHNMMEAQNLCDHVALLDGGRLVEYGAPQSLCQKYNRHSALQIRLTDGSSLQLANAPSCAGTVGNLLAQGRIAAIHSTEPDLEAVFLQLTGKELCG